MNLKTMLLRWLTEKRGMSAGRGEAARRPLLAPSITIETNILGADIAFYEAVVDFIKMKAAGIRFVIIRAGQNLWVDKMFVENWRKAKQAGIPRGSFWFYDSRIEPKEQAKLWWTLIRDDIGELVHVADLEENYKGAYSRASDMQVFLVEFQRLSGLPNSRIIIYTGFYWWTERIGDNSFFARYDLWLANYNPMIYVKIPLPWTEGRLLFWQFTDHGDGAKYGASSAEIDLNYFFDGEQAFQARFGLSNVPPSSGGITMITGTALGSVTIRDAPAGVSLNKYLLIGDKIEASEHSLQWLHLTKITHPDGSVVTPGLNWWASAGTNQQYIQWQEVITPPPPPPVSTGPQKAVITMPNGEQWQATTFTKVG